ncbi:hypothetical protein INR49_024938 [Caranx melampygus]|nr:hypothetical protein INR49_024938 [Caranx melampygus]
MTSDELFGLSFALGLDPVLTQRKPLLASSTFVNFSGLENPLDICGKLSTALRKIIDWRTPLEKTHLQIQSAENKARLDPPPNSTCFGPSPFWLFCPVLRPSSWHHHHHLSGWRATSQETPLHLSL